MLHFVLAMMKPEMAAKLFPDEALGLEPGRLCVCGLLCRAGSKNLVYSQEHKKLHSVPGTMFASRNSCPIKSVWVADFWLLRLVTGLCRADSGIFCPSWDLRDWSLPKLRCSSFLQFSLSSSHQLGSMVVGCVLGMMRMPFVAFRRLIRFIRHGVVLCLLFCGEVSLYLVCRSLLLCRRRHWGLLFPSLVLCGVLGFPWVFAKTLRSSFPLFVLCSRCVCPPCGKPFGGLMARNPASYVSCLTLVTRRMCESSSHQWAAHQNVESWGKYQSGKGEKVKIERRCSCGKRYVV